MTLADWAAKIARSAIAIEDIPYGPWKGSVESMSPDQIPREYVNGLVSHDMLYVPRTGAWVRRGGQQIKFDTLAGGTLGYGDSYGDNYGGG